MCSPAPAGSPAYSHAHPPPHWARVQELWARGPRALTAFYRGGWRQVPEGERWWEEAMGGKIEERRRAQLSVVQGVRGGMEGARGLVGA
ncbi:hypothetical protein EVG20_g4804 [Dentipellis fragilis]|uniref:Uncharacterized protein n=1 Tax=Dentipellis fragilis TaxID=205917 RepID=A0A4Y9YXI5_9AGAM|nr:hypothetical protein EVG20_g4804 [Dentipellis fragilis]